MLEKLSEQQKVVVSDPSQYIIVAAGPGTGKSVCAAGKVVHLIKERRVKPEEVLVLTQGEKSARQIQRLVDVNTNMTANAATIASLSTFCSIILEDYGVSKSAIPWVKEEHLVALIEENKHLFSLSKYDPFKRHDLKWRDLVDHFAKLESFGVTPEAYASLVSTLSEQANALQSNTVLLGGKTDKEKALILQYRLEYAKSHKEIAEAYSTFSKLKESSGKFALVDRLPLASKLVSQESVRNQLLVKYKHIIIDQIEDWGKLDWKLLEVLAFHPQSIRDRSFTIFGDDDLAIMEWAGAPRDAFQRLRTALPNAKLLPLTVNFRCNSAVLGASKSLISHNSGRMEQATGVLKTMVSHDEYDFEPLIGESSKTPASSSKSTVGRKKTTPNASSKSTKKASISGESSENPDASVYHLEFKTESDEVHGISQLLERLLGEKKRDEVSLPGDGKSLLQQVDLDQQSRLASESRQPSVGIITRFKSDANNLCKHLQAVGAPVPSPFIDHPEVKFLINILKSVLEPSDAHGLYDLLCSGMFSIPGAALAKITELHQRGSVPLRSVLTEYLNHLDAGHDLDKMSKEDIRLLKRAKKLLALLSLLDSKLGSDSMHQLVYRILKETKVLSSHRNPHSEQEEEQSENLAKFLSLVEDTEAKLQNTRPAFVWSTLKRVCMHTPTGNELEDDPSIIPVLTVWASKGSEYDYVIVPNITDDRFPGRLKRNELQELLHQAAGFQMKDSEHIAQMRRVLYTAMTRARKGIIFTYHTKSPHGSRIPLKISRFVPEVLGLPSAKYLPDRSQLSISDERVPGSPPAPGETISLNSSKLSSNPSEPPRAPSSTQHSSTHKESEVFGGGVFTLQANGKLPPLSLHALQVFMRCPLQFYQQFIINVNIPNTHLSIFQEAIGAVLHAISTQTVDYAKLSSFDKLRKTFDATWDAYGVNPVRNPEMYEQGMALSETLLDSEESHNDMVLANQKWKLAVKVPLLANSGSSKPVEEEKTASKASAASKSSSKSSKASKTSSASQNQSVIIASSSAIPHTEPAWKTSLPVTSPSTSSTNTGNSLEYEDEFHRIYSDHHIRHYLQYSESFPPETPVLQNLARIIGWAYYKHHKVTPRKVIIEYITARFQMKLLQFAPNPQHMVEAETYINSLTQQLLLGKFEANASPQNCKRCPLGNTCPSSAAGRS
jgi:superfamily I DNA/RNA helicase